MKTVIKKILTANPVVAQAVIRAFFIALGAVLAMFNLVLPADIEGKVVAAVVAIYLLIEVVTTAAANARTTADVKVVEKVETSRDGQPAKVVAGPANDMVPTGAYIRPMDTVSSGNVAV